MEQQANNKYDQCYDKIIEVFTELGYPQNFIGQWILPQRDGQAIMSLIEECQPRNILEVGTFVGMTTLLIALITSPETHTHTIDPNFPLRIEMESMRSKLYDSDADIRAQELALKAARRLGVKRKITFHAGGFSTDNTFASYNSSPESRINIIGPEVCATHGPFDFIFIDGLHYEDDVFADLTLAAEHLAPAGVIAIHDVIGRWASNVRRAVFRFLETHDDFVFSHDSYAKQSHSIGLLRRAPDKSPKLHTFNKMDLDKGSLINERLFSNFAAVLITRFAPASVIQLGGHPALLETMKNSGVGEVCALLPHSQERQKDIPVKTLNPQKKIAINKKYDLCLCIDDMELSSEESVDNVVQACVEASDTIVFASTPPGEMGLFLQNSKPLAYWIRKFYEKGYVFADAIRPVMEPHMDALFAEYQQNSSYLLNLYLVTKEPLLSSGKITKADLAEAIITRERRIEDLQLQNLSQKCIIQLYSPIAQEYKNLSNEYQLLLEQIKSLNYFNKIIFGNTLRRIKEILLDNVIFLYQGRSKV